MSGERITSGRGAAWAAGVALAIAFSQSVCAEALSLDCKAEIIAKLVLGERAFTFHVDVDDSGLTYIPKPGKGDRAYFSNADGHHFKKTESEIVWGSESGESVINRTTGDYAATLNGSVHEVGTCEKAKTGTMERKF